MSGISRVRSVVVGAVVALGLMVSGCATGPNGQLTGGLDPNFVQAVQTFTSTACAIIPTASSIVDIFNAGIGTTVNSVGQAICSVIPKATVARGRLRSLPRQGAAPAALGTVKGVTVYGWSAIPGQ